MVAKSYQGLEILCEPYELTKGRLYVRVRTKTGANKEVRWYNDAEYAKMYPEEKKVEVAVKADRKTALGFANGYITIFKGDTYSYLDWFRSSEARYARPWGWYFISTAELPAELPAGLTPIKLTWEQVTDENGVLKFEDEIKEIVDNLIYDAEPSEYVGEIGERLDLTLTVSKVFNIDSNYGSSTLHVFKDASGNIFTWTTSAKTLIEGNTYNIRGTVKDHKTFRATKQTVLTRCNVI